MSIYSKACENEERDTGYYLQILGVSFFMIVSEILPFVKKLKSNGIIELLINSLSSLKTKEEYTPIGQEEI